MIILDVTGDLDVTGNISGTNGTFGGNVGAVNGNFSGTVTAGQYNGPLQYNVQTGAGLTGGLFNNTANQNFCSRSRFRFCVDRRPNLGWRYLHSTDQ